jgi:MFS transporter, DHA1 family, inner membrane transport protein
VLRLTRERATESSVLASVVLALALMGDALLYAVLPLEAAEFGITLAGVGVLLSLNRVVRLLLFRWFAVAAQRFGLRRMTIGGAMLGALSTIAVALSSGMPALSGARIAWGIAFGILALTTLGYATSPAEGAGARIGMSLSIREAGPLVAYTGGVAMVAVVEARGALVLLGTASVLAVPLAFRLPEIPSPAKKPIATPSRVPTSRVTRREVAACMLGLLVDGIFVSTVGLLFASRQGAAGAATFAAMALAGKRLAILVLAPFAGRVGDRFGATRTLAVSLGITAAAFLLLGFGPMIASVVVLVVAAAFAGTVLPLHVPNDERREHLHDLARLNAARDLGAAIGPVVGVTLFTAMGGPGLYTLAAAALASSLFASVRPECSSRPSLERHLPDPRQENGATRRGRAPAGAA